MRSFKIYDFTLSAGGAMPLLVEGGYFKIYSCTGVLAVSIDGGSTIGPINTGQGMKTEFKRLTIVDQSGAANVGKIIVASDEFVDGRISGEVSVIDQAVATVISNKAFSGATSGAAGAGVFSHAAINNVSALKSVTIKSLALSITVAGGVSFGFRNGVLATAGSFLSSKKTSGAASIASRFYTENNAADLITNILYNLQLAANTSFLLPFREPIVLDNGWGLVVRPSSFNVGVSFTPEIVEELA